ncbi:MAG: hypothetical protein P4L73_00090 [Caulobacteraceae bacterium]|nr:hypothetical protein [Caulobacteraceae bacterium]
MLVVAPLIGQLAGVLLETPVILGLSWVASAWCVGRFRIGEATAPRLVMGAAAFASMMAAEFGVSVAVFHQSLSEHLSRYGTIPGAIGLAAQFAFAWFPLFQARPLAAVRTVHTVIYLVMAASTFFVIYAALAGVRGEGLWVSLGLLTIESVVFVGNGLKCPLSAVAVRYGAGKGPLFDTFLPEKITRHTFQVFGPLIFLGLVLLGARWLMFDGCSRWLWLC